MPTLIFTDQGYDATNSTILAKINPMQLSAPQV
jgi:hypothetical protein